jgi:hypothetical protein
MPAFWRLASVTIASAATAALSCRSWSATDRGITWDNDQTRANNQVLIATSPTA